MSFKKIFLIIILPILFILGLLSFQNPFSQAVSKSKVIPQAQNMINERISAAPKLVHPLLITEMRKAEYPGSTLKIEETLAPAGSYNRYVVSYLSEGNKINAYMTVPIGQKPATGWPVVVFNHGYIAPSEYRTLERYIAYQDAFARAGYIVFRSDYRGHADSEGIARGGYGNNDYTIDVLNGMNSVKKYKDADANRVGMWGHSMGGYITLRSMVVDPTIKAGVIWAGVVASYPDLLTKWRRPSPAVSQSPFPSNSVSGTARRWRDALVAEFGTPDKNITFWDGISANSFLKDISGPVQLHHGTADTSVPVEFSRTLEEQLENVGKPVENYEYEGDDHNISANFNVAMERSVEFMDTWVKNASTSADTTR